MDRSEGLCQWVSYDLPEAIPCDSPKLEEYQLIHDDELMRLQLKFNQVKQWR